MGGWRRGRGLIAVSIPLLSLACGRAPAPVEMPGAPSPGRENIAATVILVGDAGGAVPGDPVLEAVRARVMLDPARSTVVYLGDVVYPAGVPDSTSRDFEDARLAVQAQTDVVAGTDATGVVIPGNHDWDEDFPGGRQRILRLQRMVDHSGLSFLPRNGCPGPDAVDVSSAARIIVLDTQWWLFDGFADPGALGCPEVTKQSLLDSLGALVRDAGDREVIVAAHHPLDSFGPHGGHFSFRDHVFPLSRVVDWLYIPLPLIGSIFPAYRLSGARAQDHSSSEYETMIAELDSVLAPDRPLAFAGGHEHSLQVLSGSSVRYDIVSGAGYWDHRAPVGRKDETLYAASASGFIVLDFQTDGRVRLAAVEVEDPGEWAETFVKYLD